jgi:hypothetical protein
MTTEAKILEVVAQMPETLKQEILHYAQSLIEKYSQSSEEQEELGQSKKKRGGFGILKGKIWIADDFDEPLKDLKNYM